MCGCVDVYPLTLSCPRVYPEGAHSWIIILSHFRLLTSLSVCPPVYLSVRLPVCLSIWLADWLAASIRLSVCLTVCLLDCRVCLSVGLSLCLSVCLSLCLSIYLSLSVCLSVYDCTPQLMVMRFDIEWMVVDPRSMVFPF